MSVKLSKDIEGTHKIDRYLWVASASKGKILEKLIVIRESKLYCFCKRYGCEIIFGIPRSSISLEGIPLVKRVAGFARDSIFFPYSLKDDALREILAEYSLLNKRQVELEDVQEILRTIKYNKESIEGYLENIRKAKARARGALLSEKLKNMLESLPGGGEQ